MMVMGPSAPGRAREERTGVDRLSGAAPAGWLPVLTEQDRTPEIDLVDRPQELVLEADLPGVERESIAVTLVGNTLTLQAVRKATVGGPESYLCRERPRGRYIRAIELPTEVIAERATAEYGDGVLRIVLPKTAVSLPRRIAVTTG
jgi:HSP20 family protein